MSPNMSNLSNLNPAQPTSTSAIANEATLAAAEILDTILENNQEEAAGEKLSKAQDENGMLGVKAQTKKLESSKKDLKTDKAKRVKESILVRKGDADDLADQFSGRQGNREYHIDPRLLSLLAQSLGVDFDENASPDEMIALIRDRMAKNGKKPDVAIVDKSFEFLLEATRAQIGKATGIERTRLEAIYVNIETAKAKHFESYSIDIEVAHHVIGAVDAVVQATGISVEETLDRYRYVVHNPQDIQTLRKDYEAKGGYKYLVKDLKTGFWPFLGGNFKRTNLDNPELIQLAIAARKMQALLGVFRQTKAHFPTMISYLKSKDVVETA